MSPPHPVDLWLMDPVTATPAWIDRHRSLLTAEEMARGAAFGQNSLRHDYFCTRILQRLVLSRVANAAPGDWRFVPQAGGKPQIAAPARHKTIRFNISHTKGLIALAVCRKGEVGIDVEALDHARDVLAVADRFFAREETNALLALDEAQRPLRFLSLWTLKEAWLKATGTGFAHPLDAVRFHFAPDDSVTPHLDDVASPWHAAILRPTPAHALGLVWPRGAAPHDKAPRPRWFVPEMEP